MSLAEKNCIPCRGGVPPLPADEVADLLAQLDGWEAIENRRLTKTYRLADFKEALGFVNRIGAMAEQQNHHPDLYLAWGKVRVEIWTHKINGLTESDFVFAAKSDVLRLDHFRGFAAYWAVPAGADHAPGWHLRRRHCPLPSSMTFFLHPSLLQAG
jgi:4a-hydroxytetrahydrobiopterin dehydratase